MARNKKSYDDPRNAIVRRKATYNYYFQRLHSVAVSCFSWYGLPDEIDERFLEETLFYQSAGVYFRDEVVERDCFLNVLPSGELNIYGIPIYRQAYSGFNNYTKNLSENDSVIVYDNLIRTSIIPVISLFAERLTNIDMTIDNNLRVQKTPFILSCDEKTRLTAENLFLKVDSDVPVISLSNMADPNMLKVLKTDAPYLVDKLQMQKNQVLEEVFCYLGIGGVNYEKRERMLKSEVIQGSHASAAQRMSRLRARQQGAEMINRMFGTKISVDYAAIDAGADFLSENYTEPEVDRE